MVATLSSAITLPVLSTFTRRGCVGALAVRRPTTPSLNSTSLISV
jgi:hypothetical protein